MDDIDMIVNDNRFSVRNLSWGVKGGQHRGRGAGTPSMDNIGVTVEALPTAFLKLWAEHPGQTYEVKFEYRKGGTVARTMTTKKVYLVSYHQQFSIDPDTAMRDLTETLLMTSNKFADYEVNDKDGDDDDND